MLFSMTSKSLNSCFVFMKHSFHRPLSFQRNFDLGKEMKSLNDKKQFQNAIRLFDKHKPTDIKTLPSLTITQVLKACAHLQDIKRGTTIHQLIASRLQDDPFILTSLIHLYMQCGDVKQAELLYNNSKKNHSPMSGAMMKGYIKNKLLNKVIDIFNEIKHPSEVNLIVLFNACAMLRTQEALNLMKSISKTMPKVFYSNPRLLTSLLDGLMKCGDVEYAQSIFARSHLRDIGMFGAMMKGFLENNQPDKTIQIFHQIKNTNEIILTIFFNACAALKTEDALNLAKTVCQQMEKRFLSNPQLFTSLLDCLMKCGDVEYAQLLFNESKVQDVAVFGAMMNGFNLENMPLKTLELFYKMKNQSFQLDFVVSLCLIKALSKLGDYSLCESVMKEIPNHCLNDPQIQGAIIGMWGKVGRVDKAKQIFDKNHHRNIIDYSSMINSYGLNGMCTEAIELYNSIPSNLINEITNICVLNACSHAGFVGNARLIFQNIKKKTERIYTAMIDCLSRASLFQQAQDLIDEYERSHPPAPTMYMALLSGARNVTNSELSKTIYDRMKRHFPEMKDTLISAAVLLSNVYSSSGEMEQASNMKRHLCKTDSKKKTGVSWTVVNGQVYEFRAHDLSHPRSNEIYEENKRISNELIEYGHQYDSSWITRPLKQDETVESVLCGHSERLAIAWNFVANPNTTRIQITKNLRVCGECHRSTKLIALIRQCEIIVRDANRIHHFYKNGQCSCNDYF